MSKRSKNNNLQIKAQEIFQILPLEKQMQIKSNESEVYRAIFSDDIDLEIDIINKFISAYQKELNLSEKAQHVFSRLPLNTQSAIKHTEPEVYNAIFNSKSGNNSVLIQFLDKYEPLNEKVTTFEDFQTLTVEDQLKFKNNFRDDYAKIMSTEPKEN